MKRLLFLVILLFVSTSVGDARTDAGHYAKWNNGTIKVSSRWFELDKTKRQFIIERLYKNNS